MQGYNFTERVRRVLASARRHTARLGHEYVGTEHLLLGLLDEDTDFVCAAALANLDVDTTKLRDSIERSLKPGERRADDIDFPYTSRAKKVLEFAMGEARKLAHSYVGTEHILLGLIREENGIAAQVLTEAGVTLDAARTEIVRLTQPENLDRVRSGVRVDVPDQQFKTAIAMIELHRLRFGEYPVALEELQFLGFWDHDFLRGLRYERLAQGYTLEVPWLTAEYPPEFWHGLGIRERDPETE